MEAVRYNCNILHGPNVSNFEEIYKFLNEQKISQKINNVNQASNNLQRLFDFKNTKRNIRKKINSIGQKILEKNINKINLILKKNEF